MESWTHSSFRVWLCEEFSKVELRVGESFASQQPSSSSTLSYTPAIVTLPDCRFAKAGRGQGWCEGSVLKRRLHKAWL